MGDSVPVEPHRGQRNTVEFKVLGPFVVAYRITF
jgi:hypothetical protein